MFTVPFFMLAVSFLMHAGIFLMHTVSLFFMRYCGERVIDCNFWGVLVQNLMVGRL